MKINLHVNFSWTLTDIFYLSFHFKLYLHLNFRSSRNINLNFFLVLKLEFELNFDVKLVFRVLCNEKTGDSM